MNITIGNYYCWTNHSGRIFVGKVIYFDSLGIKFEIIFSNYKLDKKFEIKNYIIYPIDAIGSEFWKEISEQEANNIIKRSIFT